MATIKTKWFTSAMASAPVLSGSAGSMIGVLDACLKDGFNSGTVSSLVVASNVATATRTAHGYIPYQIVTLGGITGACSTINGDVRVTGVTTDTFSFSTSGISDQTATGTISVTTGNAGWDKQWSGTNLAVYRSGNVLSSRLCIKIDDTVGQYSTVRGAEQFTDINTEVNGFATNYFKKSNSTDSAARPWVIIANDKVVYLGIQWSNAGVYDFTSWGDFSSFVAGDSYNFRLQGLSLSAPGTIGQGSSLSDACAGGGQVSTMPRAYSLLVGATSLYQASMAGALGFNNAISSGTAFSYQFAFSGNHGYGASHNLDTFVTPALTDNGLHYWPVYLFEPTASGKTLRGRAYGLLHVSEYLPQSTGYSIQTGVDNIDTNLVLMARSAGSTATTQYPSTTLAFSLGEWS